MSVEQDVYRIRHATYGEEVRESIADAIEDMNARVDETEEARQDAIHAAEQAEEYRDETQQIVDDAVDDIYEHVVEEAADTYAPIATSLLEAEDREIIFNTIAESMNDAPYPELRSAPIHNAITIGGSVYPRMDNTRLGLNAIKGRTVAFNQLVPSASSSTSIGSGITESAQDANGKRAISGTRTNSSWASGSNMEFNCVNDHVYLVCANALTAGASHTSERYLSLLVGWSQFLNFTPSATAAIVKPSSDGTYRFAVGGSTNDVMDFSYIPFAIDLTQMYGSTLADSIYAMEQATPGSGVAYVKARLPLDYYAYNAGELKAPVVSGVSVTGFNLWDEEWEIIDSKLFSKNYIPVTPGAQYYLKIPQYESQAFLYVYCYDENHSAVTNIGVVYYNDSLITIPNGVFFIKFRTDTAYGTTYHNDICINASKTTGTPKNGDYLPYLSTSLSIPSTRLDGVGDAQDVLFVREDGENDYSLIKRSVMGELDLGARDWSKDQNNRFTAAMPSDSFPPTDLALNGYPYICDSYLPNYTPSSSYDKTIAVNSLYIGNSKSVRVYDSAYANATAEEFKAAVSGKKVVYKLETPTETVIAEHLTLSDISAIAENGGIISINSETGHIVQPDLQLDGFKIDTYKRDLDLKAPLASPAFTGTPTAPTPSASDNTTKLSTTAFVHTAVNAEKTRAMAVEATKADQSFAEYILLREEEDRQILFGSIVEAAEDEYSELRSAPIHNAITIGGSVYPRMDRTRMAIDAIRGRTVAFNQLAPAMTSAGWTASASTCSFADGVCTFTASAQQGNILCGHVLPSVPDHVVFVYARVKTASATTAVRLRTYGGYADKAVVASTDWQTVTVMRKTSSSWGVDLTQSNRIEFRDARSSDWDAVQVKEVMAFDLTQQYGTTLADSIYALEQATTGAGVAYVRQRMDLDYYAPNAGELKAPVVSGVGFVGFNQFAGNSEDNPQYIGHYYINSADNYSKGANNSYNCFRIPALPNTAYYMRREDGANLGTMGIMRFVNAEYVLISGSASGYSKAGEIYTTPANCAYIEFSIGITATTDVCINISSSMNGQYKPYNADANTSLSIPSTRLDGVGAAQDVLFVREDGENDYSLILSNKADEDAFSALNWSYEADTQRFHAPISNLIKSNIDGAAQTRGLMCDADYEIIFSNGMTNYTEMTNAISTLDKIIWQYTNNSGVPNLNVKDTRYTTVEAFVAAMGAKKIAYELATPTETVLAEHLTLAQISAIAENGGIISIVNENGHIVQPNVVMDTVISRSAS